MSPLSDATAEHKRREAIANLLLNRIALGLIQEARQRCGFGEDEVRLQSLADRLAAEFADRTGAEPRQSPVELELHSGGRIKLAVPFEERCRKWAELREDGVVLGGGTSESSDTRTLRPEDMAPWEREEQQQRDLARKAARGKRKFRGKHHRTGHTGAVLVIARPAMGVEAPGERFAATPRLACAALARAIGAADLDAAVACFAPDACLIGPDGTAMHGTSPIRAYLVRLIEVRAEVAIDPASVLDAAEVALAHERWTIGPRGAANGHAQASQPTLVLR